MPYPAITSRALPYNEDGTVIKLIDTSVGVIYTLTDADLDELVDTDLTYVSINSGNSGTAATSYIVVFFPELRDIDGIYSIVSNNADSGSYTFKSLQYSADTTNGLDGTWSNATCTPNAVSSDIDGWRKNIAAVSGVSGAVAIRFLMDVSNPTITFFKSVRILHIYGNKTSGETADDILILDALDSDAEFTADLDFGDRPSDTSTQWQIKLQNASSLTANNVVITVVDPNDIIRIADADTGPWNTSKTYASIASGAKTAICYVKCETPAAPTPLGPQAPFLIITVGSYS